MKYCTLGGDYAIIRKRLANSNLREWNEEGKIFFGIFFGGDIPGGCGLRGVMRGPCFAAALGRFCKSARFGEAVVLLVVGIHKLFRWKILIYILLGIFMR